MPSSKPQFDTRYIVVLGASLTQFAIIGGVFAYGLFFTELEREFGWSRTLLSACISAAFLVMGILAILGGRMNDRFGPRPVLLTTGILYAIGYFLLARIDQPWQLLLFYGLFIGIGLSTHDVVTLGTIARWFEKRRGQMTGVVKVGTAIGQMSVPPIAAYLIITFGWRSALEMLGIGAAIILITSALLMRRPVSKNELSGKPKAVPEQGLSVAAARKTRAFWTLCAAQFLFFPTLVTMPLQVVVLGQDMGMEKATAAWTLTVMAGFSIIGRLYMGGVVDKLGGRKSYILCLTPLVISLLAFAGATHSWMLFGIAALYGFAHGGLFTIVSPTIAEYFGMRDHGSIFGTIILAGTIGAAFGPTAAGWTYDVTGAFTLAFLFLAAMAFTGLLLVFTMKNNAGEMPETVS